MMKSNPERSSRDWLVGLVVLLAVLSACTDEGRARVGDAIDEVGTSQPADGAAEPAPVEPAPEEAAPPPEEPAPVPDEPAPAPEGAAPAEPPPEATAAPETVTEPPPETAPAEPASNDDGLSTGTLLVILLGGLAVVALLLAAVAAGRRQSAARAAARAALHRQLSDVVGRSRWLHDSGSVEVLLTTDHDQLTRAWNDVRTRMIDVESRISTLAASYGDGDLHRDLRYLSQCVSHLRAAEEAYVTTQLRARSGRRELTRTSTQTVHDRRQQLQAAIEPVAEAMRPGV